MMTEDEIREAIKQRLLVVNGAMSRTYLDHTDGLFRGLIWALTGVDPGPYLTESVSFMLDKAKIPYVVDGDQVRF